MENKPLNDTQNPVNGRIELRGGWYFKGHADIRADQVELQQNGIWHGIWDIKDAKAFAAAMNAQPAAQPQGAVDAAKQISNLNHHHNDWLPATADIIEAYAALQTAEAQRVIAELIEAYEQLARQVNAMGFKCDGFEVVERARAYQSGQGAAGEAV